MDDLQAVRETNNPLTINPPIESLEYWAGLRLQDRAKQWERRMQRRIGEPPLTVEEETKAAIRSLHARYFVGPKPLPYVYKG